MMPSMNPGASEKIPVNVIISNLLSNGQAITTNCMRINGGDFQACAWIVKENNWVKGRSPDLETAWNTMYCKVKELS